MTVTATNGLIKEWSECVCKDREMSQTQKCYRYIYLSGVPFSAHQRTKSVEIPKLTVQIKNLSV